MASLKVGREDRLKALVDELIGDCRNPEKLLGKDGLPKRMTQRLMECILQAEMMDRPA